MFLSSVFRKEGGESSQTIKEHLTFQFIRENKIHQIWRYVALTWQEMYEQL